MIIFDLKRPEYQLFTNPAWISLNSVHSLFFEEQSIEELFGNLRVWKEGWGGDRKLTRRKKHEKDEAQGMLQRDEKGIERDRGGTLSYYFCSRRMFVSGCFFDLLACVYAQFQSAWCIPPLSSD